MKKAWQSTAVVYDVSRFLCAAWITLAMSGVACAETGPALTQAQTQKRNEAQNEAVPLRARLAQGVAEPTVDMNGYAVNPTVRDELVQSFDEQVSRAGMTITNDGVPTRVIFLDYKERSEVGRLILGGLGGRDHVSVEVHVGETHFLISHSGFGSMNTMELVVQRVGSDAGVRVARLAGKSAGK
ncbi:MAG TPA: hypothetical protein VL424_22195 [Pararobbsia sp.]|nr:hypothetical protein [Pararobbsia sp.]